MIIKPFQGLFSRKITSKICCYALFFDALNLIYFSLIKHQFNSYTTNITFKTGYKMRINEYISIKILLEY
jgi:hypothetical protein